MAMKSTIKCISATLLFVSTCAQPASAPEEKPPEGDRIALAFVEDSSLFASAMAKIDLGPFDELLKKGEVTIEDVYEGPGFVINKFPLQGWGHRGSNEYVFGPSVRRREGIPHWKLVYQKYWCLHCDPNISDTFGIRRIDPSQFPFFELTNKSPEAERKQNGW